MNYYANLHYKGNFVGVLAIAFVNRPYKKTDSLLADHLAYRVEAALHNQNRTICEAHSLVAAEIRNLLDGIPEDIGWKRKARLEMAVRESVCVKIAKSIRSAPKIPIPYLISKLETILPDCICLEYEDHVLVFAQKTQIKNETFLEFLRSLDLIAGVSFPFQKLNDTRYYYRQASIALEMGISVNHQEHLHDFQEYILRYMVYGSIGEFPLFTITPPGLTRLLEHDAESSVSYGRTLYQYLKNNMNIAKTARDLYIHRSTFLDRMEKITSILQMDLNDFDVRLILMNILRIYEFDGQNKKPVSENGDAEDMESVKNGEKA